MSNPIEATVASYLGTAKIEWGKLKPVMCFVILWNRLEASSGNFLNLEALQEKAHAVAAKPDIQIERYDLVCRPAVASLPVRVFCPD